MMSWVVEKKVGLGWLTGFFIYFLLGGVAANLRNFRTNFVHPENPLYYAG